MNYSDQQDVKGTSDVIYGASDFAGGTKSPRKEVMTDQKQQRQAHQ